MRYEIRQRDDGGYDLYSVLKTERRFIPDPVLREGGFWWGGGDAVNWICQGTRDYCRCVQERLEAIQ